MNPKQVVTLGAVLLFAGCASYDDLAREVLFLKDMYRDQVGKGGH